MSDDTVKCPKCGSLNASCYSEHDHTFQDVQTIEIYQAPVGYMRCLDCGYGYYHHDESPNIHLGPLGDDWGEDYELSAL